MNSRYYRFILIGIVVLAGLSTVVSAATLSCIPGSVTIAKGSSTTFDIVLDSAPNGLSGYKIQVSLTDPAVGQITGVSYPSWVSFKETTEVPSDSVSITGVNAGDPGMQDVTDISLVTVTVSGDSPGSSQLMLQVDMLDANGGDAIEAVANGATITVSSSGSGSSPTVTTTTSSTTVSTTTTSTSSSSSSSYLSSSSSTTTATTATTLATSQPTTAMQETATDAEVQVTGTPGADSGTPEITTASTSDASGSGTGALPLTWVAGVVVIVVAAGIVIYLVAKKKK